MSPIVARAAIRSAAAAGRRPFSVVHSVRSFARSFEPHAFERLPASSKPAAPDYSRLVKRSAKTIAIYVPVAAAVMGWPGLFKMGLDGHV